MKWFIGTVSIALALVMADVYVEDFGFFRSGASIAAEVDVDMAAALQTFDDTCMNQTIYKLKPEGVTKAFIDAGMTTTTATGQSNPDDPIAGYTISRSDDGGYECIIRFTSVEDIEKVMVPTFLKFTNARMRRAMTQAQDAFVFNASADNSASPVIRHFADSDLAYYVIFRPNNDTLSHQLQLISIPIAFLEAHSQTSP